MPRAPKKESIHPHILVLVELKLSLSEGREEVVLVIEKEKEGRGRACMSKIRVETRSKKEKIYGKGVERGGLVSGKKEAVAWRTSSPSPRIKKYSKPISNVLFIHTARVSSEEYAS